jgi:pyruvate dehydrogenase E2 component (dihydrolipoamide acetyltransferase)
MPIEVLMPALSPTMTEGNLIKWHKKEGDSVQSGDVLAEIETDKATMEVEAVDEGTLGKIVVPEGTEAVKVNQVIALILEEGEDKSALGEVKSVAKAEAAAAPPRAEAKAAPPSAPPAARPQAAQPARADAPAQPAAAPNRAAGERIFASPLARRLAEQEGIDLSQIKGTGPQGRIVKADIEAAKGKPQAKAAPVAPAAPRPAAPAVGAPKEQVVALAGNIPYTEIPHTAMRRVIARRLTEAKQTVPHFYLTVDCEIDALLKIRSEVNAKLTDGKISVNDFVIRAVALALKKVPAANASWSDEAILRWNTIDVAVAVAIESGLITPIIKNADQKGLAVISAEMKDLAARAKSGKLKLEEFQGGTISISNLGMYGIKEFAAVINPPQGCIVAVGAGEQRPVVKNGALAIATMMSLTLSVDHRVVDGAVGAEFISEVKRLLEDPLLMLL